MYNLSTSIIAFEIVEDNAVIHSGQIPYDLLGTITSIYQTGTDRQIRYTVLQDQFTLPALRSEFIEDRLAQAGLNESSRVYSYIQSRKAMVDGEIRSIAEQDILKASQALESIAAGEQILSEYVLAGEQAHQESLVRQQLLTQEQAERINQEAFRIDMLRAQTITTVAVDPFSSVDALMSEVGKTNDVQRQIASVMRPNKEVTLSVVASTATLWHSSYEIMDVIAYWATVDKDVAEAVVVKLPSDSLLVRSLKIQRPELN